MTSQLSTSFRLEPNQVIRIFDLMPDLVYVLDLDNQSLLYANNRLLDVLGYTWEDVIEMNYSLAPVMVHDDLESLGVDLSGKFDRLAEDKTHEFVIFFRHKNQQVRELRNRASVMSRHEDGRNKLIVVVAEDVTDHRQYEKLLGEKIALLQTQNEQMEAAESIYGYGSWISEIGDAPLIYSKGLFHLLGISPEEYPNNIVDNVLYQSLVVESEREKIIEAYRKALKNKEADFTVEHQIINRRNVLKHVILKSKLYYDEQGNLSHTMGVITDRSEIQAYQMELQRGIEALKKSNQELEQFAYVASHDLQEPLRKIIAFGERLSSKYGGVLGQDGNFYVERMTNASDRMQNMIQDLLTYSRVSRQTNTFENVNLEETIKQVMSDLELKIQEKNAIINVGQLPTLEAQPVKMYQLLQNLLTNALKFTKTNVNPVISVKSEVASGSDIKENLKLIPGTKYYKITVSDNGIGFDNEYAEKIFTLFQRLHGRSEYEGTGLGLAICQKIVQAHRGQITASGILDVGTSFTIFLPVVQHLSTP